MSDGMNMFGQKPSGTYIDEKDRWGRGHGIGDFFSGLWDKATSLLEGNPAKDTKMNPRDFLLDSIKNPSNITMANGPAYYYMTMLKAGVPQDKVIKYMKGMFGDDFFLTAGDERALSLLYNEVKDKYTLVPPPAEVLAEWDRKFGK